MEDTRVQILKFIEKNCKVDPKELAVLLGTDEATVLREIKAMEQEGIICGYHTMIDWDKACLLYTSLRVISWDSIMQMKKYSEKWKQRQEPTDRVIH